MDADLKIISTEGSGWNAMGDPDVTTSQVTGALRDRVLRRFGLDSGDVTITEEIDFGGYEYTQENNRTFTVTCGEHSVRFDADHEEGDFHVTDDFRYQDSVFARFNAWLNAAESPSELIAEWFDLIPSEKSTSGTIHRYQAKKGTILWARMRKESHRGLDEMYAEWHEGKVTIVGIYVAKAPAGFRGIGFKREIGTYESDNLADTAPRLLLDLTTRFMPGSRFSL